MQIEPTAEQKRYLELAKLKEPDGIAGHSKEMWDIVRGIAVLDWALLQPENIADIEHLRTQAEEKWRTVCRKAHFLAERVLEEQHGNNGYKH